MQAFNQTAAERIAQAGARKMTPETHDVQPSAWRALRLKQFRVTNRATGETYVVSVDPARTFCQCGFYRENKGFGVCKHIVKCREEAAGLAELERREGEEAEYSDPLTLAEAAAYCRYS
jgi:hypothetical protein